MEILHSYINGNVKVTLYTDGTKIQEWSDDELANPIFPNSMDIKITNFCDLNCKFCLFPDSEVETKSGKVKIKDISINDLVYTINENSGNLEINMIENVIISDFDGELINIEVNGNKLMLTPNHKVFTQNRGWVIAENLLLTDEILLF